MLLAAVHLPLPSPRMAAMIKKIQALFPTGGLLHQAAILTLGTLLGRGIAILAMPLLARIYTPNDFSILASYSATLGILAIIACLRLDVAITMPEEEDVAASLLAIALISSIIITIIVATIVLFFDDRLYVMLPRLSGSTVIWLLPLGTLMIGVYQAIQFWATRKKKFGDISKTRITQGIGGVAAMMTLGLSGVGAVGLAIGHMIMNGAGAVGLGIRAFVAEPTMLRNVSKESMLAAVRAYRRFPLWSLPEALANVAGLQIPILLVAAMGESGEAGQLMLAMQVMVTPMALVGSSVGQVYISRAPSEQRAGKLREFTLSIIRRLAFLGAIPITLIGLSSYWIFPLVFGENWARAGLLAAMMVPWIVAQFIWSPISTVVLLQNQNKEYFFFSLLFSIFRIGGVFAALSTLNSSMGSVAFCIVNAIFYMVLTIIFAILPALRGHNDG